MSSFKAPEVAKGVNLSNISFVGSERCGASAQWNFYQPSWRAHCTSSGCGERVAHNNWNMVLFLELPWVLLARCRLIWVMNAIGNVITWRDKLGTTSPKTVPESGQGEWSPVSKHRIQHGCGEWAGWRGTGRPNLSRETKLPGGRWKIPFSLVSWPRAGLATIPGWCPITHAHSGIAVEELSVLQIRNRVWGALWLTQHSAHSFWNFQNSQCVLVFVPSVWICRQEFCAMSPSGKIL